jgi:hypothetical protein
MSFLLAWLSILLAASRPKLSGFLIMSAHQQQELKDLERNLDR